MPLLRTATAFRTGPFMLWRLALLFILLLGVLLLFIGWEQEERQTRAVEARLSAQVRLRAGALAIQLTELERSMRFLGGLPPVPGLVRAVRNGGFDAQEQSTEALWLRRLDSIFLGYVTAHPELRSLSFVGMADGGRELLRAERRDGSARPVAREALVQRAGEAYYADAQRLPADTVYLGAWHGESGQGGALVPVMHVVLPVHDARGQLFGLLVADIDTTIFLTELQNNLPEGFAVYLSNDAGEILWHPARGFVTGGTDWTAEFPGGGARSDSGRYAGAGGSVHVAVAELGLNGAGPGFRLRVVMAAPHALVVGGVRRTLWLVGGGSVALALVLGGLLVIHWRQQSQAETRIRVANESLERQVRERTAEIASASALQRAILDHAGSAIIATDIEGLITVFNPAAERMLGYRAEEMVGRLTPAVFHDAGEVAERAGEFGAELGIVLEPGFEVFVAKARLGLANKHEWTYVRKDGSRLPVLLSVTALRDGNGEITGFMGMALDISAQREARQAAEAANRAKSAFLASMSHEIRTPMNAILGMVQLLRHTRLDGNQTDYVERTELAARALLGILNDILDFSKIEAGKLALERRPFPIDRLLRNVGNILAANVGDKELEILFDIAPDLPRWLCGDELRLQQVLINLTGNALKFTERGEIVVSASWRATDEAGGGELRIAVRDTGIGISAEQREHIFDSFSQAESSTARRFGGTGLGLAISRRLVWLMGGDIGVDSRPGEGSCFHFHLPCEAVAGEEPARPDAAGMRELEVLIVDDNASARQSLADMVRGLGWRPTLAASGAEALALVDSEDDRQRRFDLLLVDWRMPDMDGWETTLRLRALLPPEASPLVLMVSAHGRELLAERLREVPGGLDGFLAKPLTPSMLYDAVADARAGLCRLADRPRQARSASGALAGLRLLLVEDNPTNQLVARELLSLEGAEVVVADGGQAALAALRDSGGGFDLVLLDIQMPDMDGYAVAQAIRGQLRLHLPIVAMTADAMLSDREAALAAGMNDHVAKPFDLDALCAVIRRQVAGDAAEPVAAAGTPAADKQEAEAAEPAVLDPEPARRRLGSEALYRQALGSFATIHLRYEKELGEALARGDASALHRVLHTLKGMAGTVGAQRLAALMRRVEFEPPEALAPREAELRQAIDEAGRAVAEWLASGEAPPDRAVAAAGKNRLARFAALLEASDMEALAEFEALRQSGEADAVLRPLTEAMERLDFPEALRLCRELSPES